MRSFTRNVTRFVRRLSKQMLPTTVQMQRRCKEAYDNIYHLKLNKYLYTSQANIVDGNKILFWYRGDSGKCTLKNMQE